MAAALHSTGATSDVLRGYLRAEMIGPLPLLPPGAAHPQTADPVFRKILAKFRSERRLATRWFAGVRVDRGDPIGDRYGRVRYGAAAMHGTPRRLLRNT
jgi:hypothetical protein